MMKTIEYIPSQVKLIVIASQFQVLIYGLPIGRNEAIILQRPHNTIVPRPNQRRPHRSNINVRMIADGISVAEFVFRIIF